MTYSVATWFAAPKGDLMRVFFGFRLEKEPGGPGLYVEAGLADAWLKEGADRARRCQSVLGAFGLSFALDWAFAAGPNGARARDCAEKAPRVGWLTYLSMSLGPLPLIPPPTEVVPVDDAGRLLVAQPEPVDESNPDHQASLAHVRHALGARVLLDGPSFPPPGASSTATPEPAPSVSSTPDVPSYLKAPAVAAAAPALVLPAAEHRSAPAIAASPMSTETGSIDLLQLLKAPLPFDPNAASEPTGAAPTTAAARSAPTGTTAIDILQLAQPSVQFDEPARGSDSERARALGGTPVSKETTEINVATLFKQAMPFDSFAKDGGPPPPATGATVALDEAKSAGGDSAAKRPSQGYTETEEFNLKDLFKRGPAVPFSEPKTVPKTAELPTAVSSPGELGAAVAPAEAPKARGRWIRFNPQTGEPLAAPYWEDLPSADKK